MTNPFEPSQVRNVKHAEDVIPPSEFPVAALTGLVLVLLGTIGWAINNLGELVLEVNTLPDAFNTVLWYATDLSGGVGFYGLIIGALLLIYSPESTRAAAWAGAAAFIGISYVGLDWSEAFLPAAVHWTIGAFGILWRYPISVALLRIARSFEASKAIRWAKAGVWAWLPFAIVVALTVSLPAILPSEIPTSIMYFTLNLIAITAAAIPIQIALVVASWELILTWLSPRRRSEHARPA